MGLRDTLRDHRRTEDDDRRFPGERRTTCGLFAGQGDRLVHVAPDGRLRDFGYPLSRRAGLASARLGVRVDGETTWFDGGNQRYHEDTALVVTDHEVGDGTVTQYDLTTEAGHLTHVEWTEAPDDAALVCLAAFEPEGREDRVGQLHHGDAVEVYHAAEHDFLASATGFDAIEGRVTRLEDVGAGGGAASPEGRYEESHLAGTVHTVAPFADGSATLASRLTRNPEREAVLSGLREAVTDHSAETLRSAATPAVPGSEDGTLPPSAREAVAADLRAVSLLTAPTGLRIAGPDFDPFYAHSGGYGYTWFRDDSEVSRFLLQADRRLCLGLADWHARSARRHCETQLDDGTWPHRVWPFDGSLAPGWANARVESGDDVAYQADQSGSVVAFLASYLPDAPADLHEDIVATLDAALDGLDASLAPDGRPERCQNAWENMDGRFTHTAATFLHGYSALATCEALPADRREHAREQATRVYDALEDLWTGDRYALREDDGELDVRLDSATFALPGAHFAYDAAVGVDDARLDRLVEHVETTVVGLRRETDEISGLVRFEGDPWRRRTQDREKLWTVSTGWGASACLELAELLEAGEDDRAGRFLTESHRLLEPMLPGGSISTVGGYLPEQFFDDGTPDSATPLGWPHAIRTATVAGLVEHDELTESVAADD